MNSGQMCVWIAKRGAKLIELAKRALQSVVTGEVKTSGLTACLPACGAVVSNEILVTMGRLPLVLACSISHCCHRCGGVSTGIAVSALPI